MSFTYAFPANIYTAFLQLSAHQLATDDRLGMKLSNYDGELLNLAHDLAERLVVAFNHSASDFPYKYVCILNVFINWIFVILMAFYR